MQFIVVEKKNKDLFTVYDSVNGGVCCCSMYTLKQLRDMTHTVVGLSEQNGKLNVFECGLDGKPRTKKAPVICTDETKRSATTIVKGLDEKHYPRVKQSRSATTIVKGLDEKHYPRANQNCSGLRDVVKQGDFVQVVIRETVRGVGVVLSDYSVVCTDGNILQEYILNDPQVKLLPYICKTLEEKQAFLQIYTLYQKEKDIQCEIKELRNTITVLGIQASSITSACNKALLDYKVATTTANTVGDECFDMSFYYSKGGNGYECFDKAKIIAVIQKTERKIYYTEGLGHKAPVINKQLTSKADALRIVQNASMLDCSAKQDGIYLNTYSASDMW